MILRNVGVEDSEGSNDSRARIRQEWVVNSYAVGKVPEDFNAVITDSGDPETLPLEFLARFLQLDQLVLAVGSPIGGAEKDQDRTLRPLY